MEKSNDSVVVVPWFSMAEWKEVYKNIFSDDTNLQQKGYERLLVWKARCSSLPAGVECTLGLMQIHLYDQEVSPQITCGQLPPYREQDLRLMYSTAVMRFLNHVSGVALEETDSFYTMASKLHIPNWIVNIRHEVAHGKTMPPLSILREALDFAFSWIYEHYWKDETDVTTNYVALEDFDSADTKKIVKKLLDLIELWQALKLYSEVGYETLQAIPDAKIKSDIYNVVQGNTSITSKKRPKGPKENLSTSYELDEQATKSVLALIHTQITLFINLHKERLTADDSLATILLEGETFLLGENLISLLQIDEMGLEEALPTKLCVLWQELLRQLQDVNLLPKLLPKLIVLAGKKEESAHRRKMAAIWAREICRGVLKAKAMEKVKAIMRCEWNSVQPISFKSDLGKFNLRSQLAHYHPDLKTAFSFCLTNLPAVDLDLIWMSIQEPSKWTIVFLPRLLKLAEPRLAKSNQETLLKVLEIYTNENIAPRVKLATPFTPYTVETLKANLGEQQTEVLSAVEISPSEPPHPKPENGESNETWSLSEDYLEWESCPMGVLPWQRKLALVDFSLPSETLWIPTQPLTTLKKTNRKRIESSEKKISWDKMKPKNRNKNSRGELEMPRKKMK